MILFMFKIVELRYLSLFSVKSGGRLRADRRHRDLEYVYWPSVDSEKKTRNLLISEVYEPAVSKKCV